MRPFFAESLDPARCGGCDVLAIFGNRNVIMTDKAFADFVGLVSLVIKDHPVFESDDVSRTADRRNQQEYQDNLFQKTPRLWFR